MSDISPTMPSQRSITVVSNTISYTASMDVSLEQQNNSSLMLAYISGDSSAFETLYNRLKGPLFRFILRQGFESAKAEELFQEIWLKIIKNRKSYSATARFETWLFTIARNHIIDVYRKLGHQLEDPIDDEDLSTIADTLEVNFETNRQKEQLLKSVETLPFEQRQTFLLRQDVGLNNQEIAKVTNTGVETVKSRLRYAMNQLKKQLGGSP